MEYVILVDDQDREIGVMEKLQAHKEGLLHRAISVFIFNSKKELLLQQRAAGKYHSPLLWTNTCCSHPRPGEQANEAAARRLFEEMGIKCKLEEVFSFTYKSVFNNGLTEHEFDHVFTGECDDVPAPDMDEVGTWAYVGKEELKREMKKSPEQYTTWFMLCMDNWEKELFS